MNGSPGVTSNVIVHNVRGETASMRAAVRASTSRGERAAGVLVVTPHPLSLAALADGTYHSVQVVTHNLRRDAHGWNATQSCPNLYCAGPHAQSLGQFFRGK